MSWFWSARHTIAHLERELAMWRTMWEVERQRANVAYDRLLNEKGVAGISAPLMPDRVPMRSPDDLKDDLEQAMAGEVGEYRL